MKKAFRRTVGIVIVFIFFGSPHYLLSQEKKITLKELPVLVRAAFEKSYPHAKVTGLSEEAENGKTFYEVESIDGKTHRDLLYTEDGKAYEIEETIAAKQLPKSVQETLRKEFIKYTIRKAESSAHGDELRYEVHLITGKSVYEVTIARDGKLIRKKELKMEKGKKSNEEKNDEDDD